MSLLRSCGLAGLCVLMNSSIAACGMETQDPARSGISSPDRFEVAEVHEDLGSGEPTTLQGARITSDGDLQVVATGTGCSAVSNLDVQETSSEVVVTVSVARLTDSACPEASVPWLVDVPMNRDLGVRHLRDGSANEASQLEVNDCRSGKRGGYCGITSASAMGGG